MTQDGTVMLVGEEIVIRVPVGATIDMAERKYDVEVTGRPAFTDELVADLRRNPVGLLADVAAALVEGIGSEAAFSRLRTGVNDDWSTFDGPPRSAGPSR